MASPASGPRAAARADRGRPTCRTGLSDLVGTISEAEFPAPATGIAAAPLRDLVGAAPDHQSLSIHQRVGDLASRSFQLAADRLPRDTQSGGGLLVAQAIEIDQAQRLDLIDGELHLLELACADADRLEDSRAWQAGDKPF